MPSVSASCRDIVALSDDEAPVTREPASSSREIPWVAAAVAADVTALSDEEALPERHRKRKRGNKASYVLVRGAVARALAGSCRCCKCLHGFRDALDDLTSLRVRLLGLHKQDMDEEALGLLKLCFC